MTHCVEGGSLYHCLGRKGEGAKSAEPWQPQEEEEKEDRHPSPSLGKEKITNNLPTTFCNRDKGSVYFFGIFKKMFRQLFEKKTVPYSYLVVYLKTLDRKRNFW